MDLSTIITTSTTPAQPKYLLLGLGRNPMYVGLSEQERLTYWQPVNDDDGDDDEKTAQVWLSQKSQTGNCEITINFINPHPHLTLSLTHKHTHTITPTHTSNLWSS